MQELDLTIKFSRSKQTDLRKIELFRRRVYKKIDKPKFVNPVRISPTSRG